MKEWLILFVGVLDVQDPGHDDFELWSPSEERNERCLFGRQARSFTTLRLIFESIADIAPLRLQTLYHRRVRERNCVVGNQEKAADKVVKNCACTESDFEWYVTPSSSTSPSPILVY